MATSESIGSDNWAKGDVLRLIELFEQETVLWNVKLSEHKNSNTRHDAITKIANALGRSGMEVDRKIRNLRSQFLREKNKVLKSQKSGAGTDEVYTPKWIFFKLLQFLSCSVEPVTHLSSMNLNLSQVPPPEKQQNDTQHDDQHDEQEMGGSDLPRGELEQGLIDDILPDTDGAGTSKPSSMASRKRKKAAEELELKKKINVAFEKLQSIKPEKKEKTLCDIYGELVAAKLKEMDERTREICMHRIDNIMFEMKVPNCPMAKSSTNSSESPHSSPPPPPENVLTLYTLNEYDGVSGNVVLCSK